MSRNRFLVLLFAVAVALPSACKSQDRRYLIERGDDVAIVQLYSDGFDRLSLRDKRLVWYLYQAAIAGRDIFIAQKCEQGLEIRDLVEEILVRSEGVDPQSLAEIRRYAKLFWVNNSP